MINLIDCENQETTGNSLSVLFDCSVPELTHQLISVDVEKAYEEEEPNCSPDEFLFRRIVSVFGIPKQPEEVRWFHLTRTFRGNSFAEGILPLGMALDTIWHHIFQSFEGTPHFSRLKSLKNDGVKDYLYRLKAPDPFHWGPFAMLVRESAFHAKRIGNHDYLALPEIIEDICNAYLDRFGLSIYDEIAAALVPCIVKFRAEPDGPFRGIPPAIYYYYKSIRKEPFSGNANTCFDAGGKVIPPERILKIEYLD